MAGPNNWRKGTKGFLTTSRGKTPPTAAPEAPAPPQEVATPNLSDHPSVWERHNTTYREYGSQHVDGEIMHGPYRLQTFQGPILAKQNGRFIMALTPDGQVVGMLSFDVGDAVRRHPHAEVAVHPEHRRRGIATAMYDWGEALRGVAFVPERGNSPYAQAFWKNRSQRNTR